MAQSSLKHRMDLLEQELEKLKERIDPTPAKPWWIELFGVHRDDPAFAEAMRLGREYRESLRPKPRSRKARRNGHP
jgi:hypothetical protein